MNVVVHGAGKAGTCLAAALRAAGWRVELRSARRALPPRIDADLVVLAVRDGQIRTTAQHLASSGALSRRAVVVHLAGALGPEELAPLRGVCRGVAQMHPMVSLADRRFVPTLAGASLHVDGDRAAVALARRVARALGMKARTIRSLDREAYHASGGLAAGGAAALAQAAIDVLEQAGASKRTARSMVGPLLRSVAENIEKLGLPRALSGVVRRGDVERFEAHVRALRRSAPWTLPLYLETIRAQLCHVRGLNEVPDEVLDEIESRAVAHGATGAVRSGRVGPRIPRTSHRGALRQGSGRSAGTGCRGRASCPRPGARST